MVSFQDLINCMILAFGVYQHNFCQLFVYMLVTLLSAGQIIGAFAFAF
jgi:hypothetical protein